LLYARSLGAAFETTAMIGRQGLYVNRQEMRALMSDFGATPTAPDIAQICEQSEGYSEGLLRFLGAQLIHSYDYSDFESATHVHDMNQPIGPECKEGYSVVLDGGTLEHIFNFPTAIRNCMEMVRLGGHYLAITPANNFFGHGFYQFSPELYFTVLSPENGFEIESMVAFEDVERPVWHEVANPRLTGARVTLQNDKPVYLLVVARRIACRPIFERTPQQSDYVPRWTGEAPGEASAEPEPGPTRRPIAIRLAKRMLPAGVRQSIRKALARPPQPVVGFDPRFFRPINPAPSARTSQRQLP
jgi:hypothetical protein